jgi:hypothetical protein
MKVLYSLSHQVDWIAFAKAMSEKRQWNPVYWLTTNVTEPLVREEFPNCITHKYPDVIRGMSPDSVNLYSPYGIDEAILREYSLEMDIALKMMDRLDSGDAFSYNERKSYFIKILNYSLNVFHTFNPQLALFTEVPHHATQYILYAVLKKMGVTTLMFKPVYVYDLRLLIYNSIDDDPFTTIRTDEKEIDLGSRKIISEYVKKLQKDYTLAQPDYMRKIANTQGHSSTVVRTFLKLIRFNQFTSLFDSSKATNILKMPKKPLEKSFPNRFNLYWYKWKGSLKKRKLKSIYQKLQVMPDLNKRFVFVPLQYQPERTSSPDGGVFVDQFLMISLLRSCLPNDVAIFVKEHISQFHPSMDGHLGRFEYNYYDLIGLENVFLVPTDIPSFSLIDHSWAVATITGTVGLESLARKKPVFVFGQGCWYRSSKGVFYIKDKHSLLEAVNQVQSGISFNERDLIDFMERFHKLSFVGKLTPSHPIQLSVKENADSLSRAVDSYVRAVYER